MASWLVCLSPGRGHCASLRPGVKMGTCKLLGKPNKLQGNDLRWTSIPSRGSRNTPSRFMLQKPGISSGSYEPVGSKAPFLCFRERKEKAILLGGEMHRGSHVTKHHITTSVSAQQS